jgi:hypothetical protein
MYRARDTKLHREVAIKVLPAALLKIPKDWLASSVKPKCSPPKTAQTLRKSTASKTARWW